jgi:hypothetical protein
LIIIGWPRCILFGCRSWIGKMDLLVSLVCWSTCLLKRILDLFQFGVWPEELQKLCRMLAVCWACCGSAVRQMMRSSAKKRMYRGQSGPSLMQERWLSCRACWRKMDSSLIARTKMYGDKGHPCRIPLCTWIGPKGWSLISTENVVVSMQVRTRLMKWSWNPWRRRACTMKGHSIHRRPLQDQVWACNLCVSKRIDVSPLNKSMLSMVNEMRKLTFYLIC